MSESVVQWSASTIELAPRLESHRTLLHPHDVVLDLRVLLWLAFSGHIRLLQFFFDSTLSARISPWPQAGG